MIMQDHAKEPQARLIGSVSEPVDPLASKRRSALAYLGERHIMHSAYKPTPRHSFSFAISAPHSVLRPIYLAAKQAGRI